jgi:RNA 2',3'-cyclic 3'-phosphodiesterase
MKRTFIAVKTGPTENLEKAVQAVKQELRSEPVKWVDLNQAHITLAFLGDTSEESIKEVSEMLSEKCGDFGEVEFTVRGIGIFRSMADPRVIWAGIEDKGKLARLYTLIKEGLDELGIKTEERQFNPHITIARVRSLRNQKTLQDLIGQYQNVVFQKAAITEVIFFESILQQTGPLYLPIKKIRL